jgi:hypothetical protein
VIPMLLSNLPANDEYVDMDLKKILDVITKTAKKQWRFYPVDDIISRAFTNEGDYIDVHCPRLYTYDEKRLFLGCKIFPSRIVEKESEFSGVKYNAHYNAKFEMKSYSSKHNLDVVFFSKELLDCDDIIYVFMEKCKPEIFQMPEKHVELIDIEEECTSDEKIEKFLDYYGLPTDIEREGGGFVLYGNKGGIRIVSKNPTRLGATDFGVYEINSKGIQIPKVFKTGRDLYNILREYGVEMIAQTPSKDKNKSDENRIYRNMIRTIAKEIEHKFYGSYDAKSLSSILSREVNKKANEINQDDPDLPDYIRSIGKENRKIEFIKDIVKEVYVRCLGSVSYKKNIAECVKNTLREYQLNIDDVLFERPAHYTEKYSNISSSPSHKNQESEVMHGNSNDEKQAINKSPNTLSLIERLLDFFLWRSKKNN